MIISFLTDKKTLKKNIQKYGYSYEEVEQWKDYFDKELIISRLGFPASIPSESLPDK